jgi:hypothetical protein
MKKIFKECFLLLVLIIPVLTGYSQNSPPFPITNSNWIATDALGRRLPDYKKTGPTKNDKWVGLFYYVWHGGHTPTDTIYDITKILNKNPYSPEYGPRHYFHYWGEPEAGYYHASDPWVIRRNISMMAAAGVDFIYFDVTNAFTYLPVVAVYCEISLEMRKLGINAPYISFMTHSSEGKTMNSLYDEIYSLQKYKDLWFLWEGKPLIFGNPDDTVLRPDVRNFFNIKYSWAWTDAQNQPNQWQWIDKYPQNYGWSTRGVVDQLPVAVASHPTSNIGNSYSGGSQPVYNVYKLTPFTGQGRHFQEQWKQVFALQPKVVMITQFNEWMAQRFVNGLDANPPFLDVPAANGNTYFVDAFNEEYNRDIEPMKGGHTDNMYFQMVSNIRYFKGMKARQQTSAPKRMEMDGQFSDWMSVEPVYFDYEGDTFHRNVKGANKKMTYINATGRNDIVESRVNYDADFVYFYARTSQPLTPHTDKNWMMLYLNTDTIKSTGWEGYELLVNSSPSSNSQTSLKKFENGNWSGEQKISYAYSGNEIELAIPIGNFKTVNNQLFFSFHWSDNCQKLLDINEFFINGESAPDRRFDYLFSTETVTAVIRQVDRNLMFYPNPAKDEVNLQWPLSGTDKVLVTITNLSGVQQYSELQSVQNGFKTINVNGYSNGIYILRFTSGSFDLTGKLLIIR